MLPLPPCLPACLRACLPACLLAWPMTLDPSSVEIESTVLKYTYVLRASDDGHDRHDGPDGPDGPPRRNDFLCFASAKDTAANGYRVDVKILRMEYLDVES